MSNPFDQFDAAPAANPFDAFDTQPTGFKAGDAAKLAARGATSEGLYFGVEGATRAAQNLAPDVAANVPGTQAAGVDVELERLRTRRRELSGQPSRYSISSREESPAAIAEESALQEIDAAIAQLEARQKDIAKTAGAAFKWYADAVADTRERIRRGLPVETESEQALWGQVAQGIGQAIGTLPTYVIPGFGPSVTAGQLYQEGYEDAKRSGADDQTAHDAGMKNAPAAALEYLSDKVLIGKVLKPLKGKLTVGQFLTTLGVSAASEGATEGAQTAWQNYVARELSGYDTSRQIDDEVIRSATVGAIVGGIVGGGGSLLSEGARRLEDETDTGQNKPERPEDLRAQQQQLVKGDRAVQMFPLGTAELPLPEGMQRVETPRGVFHFDPRAMTADEILSASQAGRENELLGLGPFSKPEVLRRAKAGEPLATMVERGPNGEELRGAVVVPSTADATRETMEENKSAGSTVKLERLPETLARRGLAEEIERDLPDTDSRDYVRGRNAQEVIAKAQQPTDHAALWKETVDGVVQSGATPAQLRAISSTLAVLTDKKARKEAGLRGLKISRERIANVLSGTAMDGALRGSTFAKLVDALARSPENITALRNEFLAVLDSSAPDETSAQPASSLRAESGTTSQAASATPAPAALPSQERELADKLRTWQIHDYEGETPGAADMVRHLRAQLDRDFPGWEARVERVRREEQKRKQLAYLDEARRSGDAGEIAKWEKALDTIFPGWRDEQPPATPPPRDARTRLREQIAAEAAEEKRREEEVAGKKAAAEKALADAAEKRKAERERMENIERTGRDPESGLIVDLRRVPASELENFDWDKDRFMHDGEEVRMEDIEAVLMQRAREEERDAATGRDFTLGDLLKGKRAALQAAGLGGPLRLMSPKEARERGTLAGEHAALRERTGGFAYFSRDGLAEDKLQEQLAELGFDAPDVAAAYALIERAMNGEEIRPTRGGETQFSRRGQPTQQRDDLAAIEAKMERGAVDRDVAARAVNRFIDVQEGKAKWPTRMVTKKRWSGNRSQLSTELEPSVISEAEARALNDAVRQFDTSDTRFSWPDDTLRLKVLSNFARRDHKRAQQMATLAEKWWQNLEAIAPGLAQESELRFGSSEALVEEGLARRDELTGEEEAARVRDRRAKREIFYLFDRALRKNTTDVTRLNLQHEMGHAFWDTLDRDTQAALLDLWQDEISNQRGPLFVDGALRDNVALGVTEDVQEWFAERLAHANDGWAKRRIEARAKGDSLMAALAARFRALLVRMRELAERYLQANGYDDALVRDFRRFLDQGTQWRVAEDAPPAAAAAFVRREGKAFDDALREFDRLERARDRLNAAGQKVPHELLAELSEARTALENSWPGWREERAARAAQDEANALKAPEPERGVTAVEDTGREVRSEVTSAKVSALMASHYKPAGRLQQWIEGIGRMFLNFRSDIPELPGGAKGREFTRFRQGHRMLRAATEAVRREAEDRVAHVVEPIMALDGNPVGPSDYRRLVNLQAAIRKLDDDAETPVEKARVAPRIAKLTAEMEAIEEKLESLPYHLFRKIILLRDLWFRGKLLNLSGESITLPFNLTREGVEQELRRLHDKLAAHEHRGAIDEALKRHYALVKTTRDDLLARGYVIPEELRNPLYFPHVILEKFSGRVQRVKMDTAEDFRGYLQQLVGSAKDIEADYLTAMYYHMGQVLAHNAREDIVANYWQPYDIKERIEEEAEKVNEQRAEQGLGPLPWQAFVPKDHVIFTVDKRLPLRPGYIIDRGVLAERLGVELGEGDLQAQLREQGLDVIIRPDDISAALLADEKIKWVLPREIAAALNGILERETKSRSQLARALSLPQTAWKWWKLFSPTSAFRYTYGNLVADVEKLFSADPRVFRYLLPAYREVREFAKGGDASPDLREAFRRGVIQSQGAVEVNDLVQAERFEQFLTTPERYMKFVKRGVQIGAWVNQLRESAFRYAKFKADLDRMRAGKKPVYAGAFSRDVEAITGSDAMFAKAAEISRKTFVDYDAISVSGDGLRKYWVPFYSWMEGNFRYHANLFRNLADMSAGAGMAQLARGGLVAASKVVLPRSVTGVLLRLALPYVAMSLWNSSGDREEIEKDLSEEDRRRFHIILGRDEKGRAIVVMGPTAFSDVAEWFGGNEFARLAGEYFRGDITFPQFTEEWLASAPKGALNKATQGINPFLKTIIEAVARRSFFPDVTDPKPISDHDLAWHVLASMTDLNTADWLRRAVDADEYGSKTLSEQVQQIILQARRRDPEQWGFYATMAKVDQWNETHGRGGFEPGADNRADAQLLRSFRRSIRNADVPAALEFYHRLLDAGYTAERFSASVRRDPLQGLKREDRQAFVESLNEAERHNLKNAYRYWQRMEVFRHREPQLFPSEKASQSYKDRFATTPRDDVFAGLMLDAAERSDDDEELRAEKLLQAALRPR